MDLAIQKRTRRQHHRLGPEADAHLGHGTNGAGKTTTLRTISGLLRGEGEIWFAGERIDQVPAHLIVARGLAHSPEGRRIFPKLTVEDNLLLETLKR